MNRTKTMQDYWNEAAKDPDVEVKYICDLRTEDCLMELGAPSGDIKVLEIGSGTGRLLPAKGHGIDISEGMIKLAKKNRPDCVFKLTTGDIPYPDETFDFVYSMLVFQHLKPNEVFNYIKEAHRVLRPGKRFKFQFIAGDEREPFSNHYDVDEVANWIYSAGFDRVTFTKSEVHHLWMWAEAVK